MGKLESTRMNAQKTQSQETQPRARTKDPETATCFSGHRSPSRKLAEGE